MPLEKLASVCEYKTVPLRRSTRSTRCWRPDADVGWKFVCSGWGAEIRFLDGPHYDGLNTDRLTIGQNFACGDVVSDELFSEFGKASGGEMFANVRHHFQIHVAVVNAE